MTTVRGTRRGRRPTRLTRRGLAVLVVGTAALAAGTALGVVVLVQLGLMLLLAVGSSLALLGVTAHRLGRGALQVARTVRPHPVTVGAEATVTVRVTARPPTSVARLEVAERAARELSGGAPLRARMTRQRTELALAYPLVADTRGRWAVGPLQVRHHDLFGLALRSGTLGDPFPVAVRPRTTPLRVTTSALASDADRAVSGTRMPAADDTLLRGYVAGDDLRRVHWPSSARRGELLVRQDEASGRRPATVLLDLAVDPATTEWSIRLAASIAVALANAGHHVRLLGGDALGAASDHHRPEVGEAAADALLDRTVDLRAPLGTHERHAWLRTAVDTLHADAAGTELVLAVVGSLPAEVLTTLAETGGTTHGWALVRSAESAAAHRAGGTDPGPAQDTVLRLRRAGWTACLVHPDEDVAACWERLLASDEGLLVAR